MKRVVVAIPLLMLLSGPSLADDKPQLLGYGVKSCEEYRKAYKGWEKEEAADVIEYQRYSDWLTGFVSGMGLATGTDVMRGVSINSILRRNQVYCTENTESDFFNATMELLKDLKKLP